MNYAAWYNGAYGDCAFSIRGDGEDRTVSCLTCGEDLPAHFEDGELVADEACDCEDGDEEEPIDDPQPLRAVTSPIHALCDDIARSYKHTLGGTVPPKAD